MFNESNLEEIAANILKQADTQWGGFGRAPKFPQTFTIRFLLHYYSFTGNQEALDQAKTDIEALIAS